MKGIVLAGGSGTRLHPITKGISKQLIPIYDKPMVYYPISTLMLAGIREILIISTPQDLPAFKRLLGDGAQLGVSFSYREQPSPDGLAQALIIGEEFVGKEPCCLILGDNIFYGQGFAGSLNEATIRARDEERATIFGCYVTQPERFGVAVFDETGQLKAIEEKPDCPKSHYAVAGLYFYPAGISDLAHQVKPSARGELEITTLNQMLLDQKRLHLHKLGRGFTWLDTGTIDALTEASAFVEAIQKRQGLQIANLEEIAWRQGWLDDETLRTTARQLRNSQYGQYLLSLTSTLE